MKKQKTIEINGQKFKIVAVSKSYMRNPNGFNITVSCSGKSCTKEISKTFYTNHLDINLAMESGYNKFIKFVDKELRTSQNYENNIAEFKCSCGEYFTEEEIMNKDFYCKNCKDPNAPLTKIE